MAPVVDRLAAEFSGTVEVRKLNMDTDAEAESLASSFGVVYVPTFVLVNSDGTVAQTLIGEIAESEMRAALDALE